jgi:hypothetical protein
MPTIAIVALALLSLLAGSLIEPPAAKAAARGRSVAANSSEPPPAAAVKAADKATHRVVSEDISVENGRRYVAVVMSRRIMETEIERIADAVRAKEKMAFDKTIVNFYLPGMKLGQGAWAIASYNPARKIQIVGLRLDEEETAAAEAAADPRRLIGVWLTAPPAAPGRLTLYRDGVKIFAERRLRDGSKSVEELTESRDKRSRRFEPLSGGTQAFVITPDGAMELRDGAVTLATAERLAGIKEHAALETPAVKSKTTTRVSRQRQLSSTLPSAPATSGQVLSDKLFKVN